MSLKDENSPLEEGVSWFGPTKCVALVFHCLGRQKNILDTWQTELPRVCSWLSSLAKICEEPQRNLQSVCMCFCLLQHIPDKIISYLMVQNAHGRVCRFACSGVRGMQPVGETARYDGIASFYVFCKSLCYLNIYSKYKFLLFLNEFKTNPQHFVLFFSSSV